MPQSTLFRWTQWVWPVLIGVVAAAGVVWLGANHEVIDPSTQQPTTSLELLRAFTWSSRSTWALLAVIACVLIRDLGYIIRLRILSFKAFSWRQSTENILLWELSSALTPSVVGGSAAAVVILHRDGLKWGKSLATVFATAMLDEAFYLLAVPLVFGLSIWADYPLFPTLNEDIGILTWGMSSLFWMAYGFIALLTSLMWFGLVLRPEKTHQFIQRLSTSRALRKWDKRIKSWSKDLLEASRNIRHAPRSFWIQGFAATCASWTARFLTLNAVLLIFYPHIEHGAVLARQLVLWIVLSISPTPGSSGAAELGVPAFLGDITGLAYMAGVVLVWRIMTYFIYLLAGTFVLPQWWVRTQNGDKRP